MGRRWGQIGTGRRKMSVNNVIKKWLRRFVLHFLHPPPRMKEPPLMTSWVSPLNHVDLPVSMHSFGAVSGAEYRGRGSLSCSPFKRLNLGIANAYLKNTISRSQIIADGLGSRVACRFRLWRQTLLKVDADMKKWHHALPKTHRKSLSI